MITYVVTRGKWVNTLVYFMSDEIQFQLQLNIWYGPITKMQKKHLVAN